MSRLNNLSSDKPSGNGKEDPYFIRELRAGKDKERKEAAIKRTEEVYQKQKTEEKRNYLKRELLKQNPKIHEIILFDANSGNDLDEKENEDLILTDDYLEQAIKDARQDIKDGYVSTNIKNVKEQISLMEKLIAVNHEDFDKRAAELENKKEGLFNSIR